MIIRSGAEIERVLKQAGQVEERIEQAASKEELRAVSRSLPELIQTLHALGIRVQHLGRLISGFNQSILDRLYALLAPPELVENACLLVMGSEGREEQILKTDQDNAIILRDGFECPKLQRITEEFTETLVEFGYPRCPGDIMVSNPYWAKPASGFKQELSRWIRSPDEESFMRFAIFFDARTVAGDERLLRELRDHMFDSLRDNEIYYSHFAKVILAFGTPLRWFGRFAVDKQHNGLDIKKGGVFPIVHGVRSLALKHRLDYANTLDRIEVLSEEGHLEQSLATDLSEAFTALSALRLKAGLEKLTAGQPIDNYLDPRKLSRLEQTLLRESLRIVNRFKQSISRRFRLDLVG